MAKAKAVTNALQQGTRGRDMEVLQYTYYDTLPMAAATAQYRFFTQALGQGTPQKTLAQTNMTQSSQMPQGQNLTVNHLYIQYWGNDLKNNASLQEFYKYVQNTSVEFVIPGKDSLGTWKLSELMGFSNYMVVVPTVAGDNIPFSQVGKIDGKYKLNIPIVLAALQAFEVRVQKHATILDVLDDDTLTIGLCGVLKRQY